MSSFIVSNRKEDCCGCRACDNICAHHAIDMIADEEGFLYPIKNDNCIDCGLCEKVCPYSPINIENEKAKQDKIKSIYPKTYAAYSEKDRIGSSSGGIFYTLAKHIIEKNGTVYGAAFDDDFQLHHVAVRSLDDLKPLRGSKYLQSNTGHIFSDIRDRLKKEEYVLFVGTPCQVAGLRAFLRKDYSTLYTADLICHGTPSQWMFDQHKAYLENKYKAKLVDYHFRNEEMWGGCEIADFADPKKGKIRRHKLPSYDLSPYLYSFMYAFDYRHSCYECPFAKVPRIGDITLGDYWGIKNVFPTMDSSRGVSAILVNSPQGEVIWNEIKDSLIYKESDFNTVGLENKNLLKHTEKPSIRDSVYKLVKERGYEDVANKEFRSPRFKAIKKKILLQKVGIWQLMEIVHNVLKRLK